MNKAMETLANYTKRKLEDTEDFAENDDWDEVYLIFKKLEKRFRKVKRFIKKEYIKNK